MESRQGHQNGPQTNPGASHRELCLVLRSVCKRSSPGSTHIRAKRVMETSTGTCDLHVKCEQDVQLRGARFFQLQRARTRSQTYSSAVSWDVLRESWGRGVIILGQNAPHCRDSRFHHAAVPKPLVRDLIVVEVTSPTAKKVPVQSYNSFLDQRSGKVIVLFHTNHFCSVGEPLLRLLTLASKFLTLAPDILLTVLCNCEFKNERRGCVLFEAKKGFQIQRWKSHIVRRESSVPLN